MSNPLLPHRESPKAGRPSHISIALVTGEAGGVTVRRMANSAAVVITAPIGQIDTALSLPETARRGVYVILETADHVSRAVDAYVGEAGIVQPRIRPHLASLNVSPRAQIAMIVSAHNQLVAEEISYLERRLIDIFAQSPLAELHNRAPHLPRPTPPKIQDSAERFLDDAFVLLAPVEPVLAGVRSG